MSQIIYWEQRDGTMQMIGEVPAGLVEHVRDAITTLAQPVHGNSEAVFVIEIDHAEYSKHLAPHGKAKPLEDFATFPSALAASHHLGFGYNMVCQALSNEKRKLEQEAEEKYGKNHTVRIRPEATVRGVRFQYERDCKD